MEQNEPLVRLSDNPNMFSVSPEVNAKGFHDAFLQMPLPRPVAESAYVQAGRILQKADGTQLEYMAAINSRTGRLIVDNLDKPAQEGRTGLPSNEADMIRQQPDGAIIIHNHPSGSRPSLTDLTTAAREACISGSIVVGHDGSVWYFAIRNTRMLALIETTYANNADKYGDRGASITLNELLEANRGHKLFVWRKMR